MSKLARPNKLNAYKCNSCGGVQVKSGSCEKCGYGSLKKISITRKDYCGRFGHISFQVGDKKLTSSLNCCTENYTYQCKRCGSKVEGSQTDSYGCYFHGPLS